MSTAGILIIGNEILTGKVEDENAPYLLRELRKRGVDVHRVHTILDDVDVIADEVRSFSERYDYVLTTGGVGPTHDDVTMDGVAAAFDRKLVRDERMEAKLRQALRGREANDSHLKMCEIPEGAELIETPDLWFPLVRVENVFVFPGIPRLLQSKFEGAKTLFVGAPVYLRNVYVTCIETDIAQDLRDLLVEFPELDVGSYPKFSDDGHRTLITLESRDKGYVGRALDSLVNRIPRDYIIRVE
jgi:molybdenum cofactor synthesis domain-containing protein